MRVKCYAKINLTLEVLNKRFDGFHNIHSIMQNIDLYDVIDVKISNCNKSEIIMNGNDNSIYYDSRNIVYRAIKDYIEKTRIENKRFEIYIEKNIPVSAGLGGGSSDAVGTVALINKYFNNCVSDNELNKLFSNIGSDLNFIYTGGTCFCSFRGEVVKKLKNVNLTFSLIKPKNLGISAKEAYEIYSQNNENYKNIWAKENSEKLAYLINNNKFDKYLLVNDLEKGLIELYPDILGEIKNKLPNSYMTGSGSVFFVVDKKINVDFNKNDYLILNNIKSVDTGFKIESIEKSNEEFFN